MLGERNKSSIKIRKTREDSSKLVKTVIGKTGGSSYMSPINFQKNFQTYL